MNPVVHFEMPCDDSARMARFFEAAFGWLTQVLGAEMGGCVTAATSPPGADGRPQVPGAINGGFFPRKADWPAQVPSVVIAVDDIQAAMRLYMRDTYDFIGPQYLGHWNENGMGFPVAAALARAADFEWHLAAYSINHGWMTAINNSDFDNYRKKSGQGNDLLVFSDVLPFDTLIEVQL